MPFQKKNKLTQPSTPLFNPKPNNEVELFVLEPIVPPDKKNNPRFGHNITMSWVGKNPMPGMQHETWEVYIDASDNRLVKNYRDIKDSKERALVKPLQKFIEIGNPWKFHADLSSEKGKMLMAFYANHPLVEPDGEVNINLTQPLFRLIRPAQRANIEYAKILEKRDILDKTIALSYEKKVDLMFLLGANPKEKNHGMLTVDLIGPNFDGLVFAQNPTSIQTVLEFFRSEGEGLELKVLLKKCLMYGYINPQEGHYKLEEGQIMCPADDIAAYKYLNDHPDVVKMLTRKVKERESLIFTSEKDNLEEVAEAAEARNKEKTEEKAKIY